MLASKGGKECAKGDTVSVTMADLQDMQNHMRETIDQGMGELQAKQGKGGLPALPPSANVPPAKTMLAMDAPPPIPPPLLRSTSNGAKRTSPSRKWPAKFRRGCRDSTGAHSRARAASSQHRSGPKHR